MTGRWEHGASVPRPNGATDLLDDFVAGRSTTIRLDTADAGWISNGRAGPPLLAIRPGATATSVTLSVSWGLPAVPSPEVFLAIVNGHLSIDARQLSSEMRTDLETWVQEFNRELSANHRELSSFAVAGTMLEVSARAPQRVTFAQLAPAGALGLAAAAAVVAANHVVVVERPHHGGPGAGQERHHVHPERGPEIDEPLEELGRLDLLDHHRDLMALLGDPAARPLPASEMRQHKDHTVATLEIRDDVVVAIDVEATLHRGGGEIRQPEARCGGRGGCARVRRRRCRSNQRQEDQKELGLDIIVSPQRETWNKLRTAADTALASLLRTDAPRATRGVPVEVTSTFTYPADLEQFNGLMMDLLMDTEARAEISPADPIQSGQTVAHTWTITPYETGPLGLKFWLVAESQFIDGEPYVSGHRTVFLEVSEPAAPPRGTIEAVTDTADGFFSAVVYIAGGLAIIVGLLLAIGAKAWWQKRKSSTAAAAGSGASEPPTT